MWTTKFYYLKTLSRNGFTLIEILLVVLLLSVVAALIIPSYSRTYNNIQLKNTAKNIVHVMRYAQGRAVTKSRILRLEFNPELTQYWLKEKSGHGNDDDFEHFSGRMGNIFDISSLPTIEMDQEFINFYPNGKIDRQHIFVCDKTNCLTISTKEQRGYVWLFDSKIE